MHSADVARLYFCVSKFHGYLSFGSLGGLGLQRE